MSSSAPPGGPAPGPRDTAGNVADPGVDASPANVTTTARSRTLSIPPVGLDVRTSQALATVAAQMRPSPRDVQEIDSDEIGFVLELARALHRYGTPAHRLEEAIVVVCRRLELAVEVFRPRPPSS